MSFGILFSIVILTYNEEKTIGKLIDKIVSLKGDFNKELIIIDSESIDATPFIIKEKVKKYKNIRFYKIKKREFDFGKTRNYAVKLARGEYVCFISGDCEIIDTNFLDYFLQDFNIDRKVVAVFGKQIPRENCSFFYKIELKCLFDALESYIKRGETVLIQKLEDINRYKKKNDFHLYYFLPNGFSCYKKSFLIENEFDIGGSEDLRMGKKIIDSGYIKIYDPRAVIVHSHNFNIVQYYKRQVEEYNILLNKFKVNKKNRILCKFKKVFSESDGIVDVFINLIIIIFFYLLKFFVYIIVQINKFKYVD